MHTSIPYVQATISKLAHPYAVLQPHMINDCYNTDGILGVVILAVSVIVVFPVAGPAALVTYCVLKKTGAYEKGIKLTNNTVS